MEAPAPAHAPRVYRRPMPAGWFVRKSHYFWYVVREFTALPLALWLLWLLYNVSRSGRPMGQVPGAYVAFSILCLPFALYHSWTFLSLAGSIIHLKVLDRPVSSRLIVASQFALWIGASILIAFLLVWLAR